MKMMKRQSVSGDLFKKQKKKSWRNCTDMRWRRKKEVVIFRCLLDCHNMTQQTTSIHKRTVFYPPNSRWDENVPPDNRKLKFLHFCGCLVQQDWKENYIRVCSAVENLNRAFFFFSFQILSGEQRAHQTGSGRKVSAKKSIHRRVIEQRNPWDFEKGWSDNRVLADIDYRY